MNAVIRPARAEEYDEIARIWMESWVSTGLAETSDFLLEHDVFIRQHILSF